MINDAHARKTLICAIKRRVHIPISVCIYVYVYLEESSDAGLLIGKGDTGKNVFILAYIYMYI
jgi:hypothetical protein